MTEDERYQERKTAIHMIRSGVPVTEVAQQLGRSIPWVYKWRSRFKAEGWAGLHRRSRAPKHCPRRLPERVRQSICQARSELDALVGEHQCKTLAIDMASVKSLPTSFLSLLTSLSKQGVQIELLHPLRVVRESLELTKLDRFFTIRD